ncbi:MAG: hypothetical protein GEU90_00645 [Gemmatimonas sp.]|nr:hypothetical protein [Gemmatimonas sp.]
MNITKTEVRTIDIDLPAGRCLRLTLSADELEVRSGWSGPWRGDPAAGVSLPAYLLDELMSALRALSETPGGA